MQCKIRGLCCLPPPPPASSAAWFLDVDGTLLELAPSPDEVVVGEALRCLLRGLNVATDGALAIVSGRSIDSLDRLFRPLSLAAAGQHGAELRGPRGQMQRRPVPGAAFLAARQAIMAWSGQRPGLLLEDKGQSLAVHFRLAPAWRQPLLDMLEAVVAASDGELLLQAGKMVFEVLPAGRNKGAAIGDFMLEPPFAGRLPVFVGDDATDESGFAEVNRLGGLAVKVGPGPTCAPWRLPDVPTVREWLALAVAGG